MLNSRRLRRLTSRQTVILIASLCALVIAFLWLAVLFQTRYERSAAIAAAVRDNENRVITFERYVVRTLEAAELAARYASATYGRQTASPRPTARGRKPAILADPITTNPLFSAVVIADSHGDVIATTLPDAPPLNIAHRRTFQSLRSRPPGSPLVIGRPIVSPMLGKPLVALSGRIDNRDGSFGGDVIIQIEAARFIAFAEGALARESDLLSAIRLDGITLARRTAGELSYGEDLRGRLVMRMQMSNPNGTYLGPSSLDGIERYFSHRRLTDYPIFVTSGIGRDEILAPVDARARRYQVAGALLTVACLALAALLIASALRGEREARLLAEINARLRDAQRIGRIGDWEYDIAAGRVRWSDQLCAMYRRAPSDDKLTLDDAARYFTSASREAFEAAVAAAVAGAEAQQLDIVAELTPGELSHRRLSIVPVVGAGGVVERLVGTDQDVTPDKLHEQLRAQVAHGARVDAINAMASTLAHELAQPLTAAANFLAAAQRLTDGGAPDEAERAREALTLTQRHLNLAGDILRRARDMVSGRLLPADDIDLIAAVDDVFAMIGATTAPSGVKLVRKIDAAGRYVVADRVQLQQVLTNLVRNACDAVAGRPRPRVTVSSEPAADDFVTIVVADNGPGLPADFDEALSPFASTKAAGLGLGLTIARALVLAHGGRLWFEHAEGAGATVRFTVPARGPDEG